jgi:hypothetical protein
MEREIRQDRSNGLLYYYTFCLTWHNIFIEKVRDLEFEAPFLVSQTAPPNKTNPLTLCVSLFLSHLSNLRGEQSMRNSILSRLLNMLNRIKQIRHLNSHSHFSNRIPQVF